MTRPALTLCILALAFTGVAQVADDQTPAPPPLPGASQPPPPPGMPPGMGMPPGVGTPPSAMPPMPEPAPAKPIEAPPPPSEAIPSAFPVARYEASWKKNPFLLKTAPVAVVHESPFLDWALSSIAEIGGKHRVSMKNKKTGEYERISTGETSKGGFTIVTVNMQARRSSTSVELRKGDETGTVTYDETATAAAVAGRNPAIPGSQPGMARPGMPNMPAMPNASRSGLPTTSSSSRMPMPVASSGAGGSVMPGGANTYQPGTQNNNFVRGVPIAPGGGSTGRTTVGNPNLPAGSAANPIARATTSGSPSSTGINANINGVPGASAVIDPSTVVSGTIGQPQATTNTGGPRRRTLIPAPTVNQ